MRRGGRAFIVDANDFDCTLAFRIAATGAQFGQLWLKTLADLFSDLLCLRQGQLVFFWDVRVNNTPGRGFTGVYAVTGEPFYDDTELALEASTSRVPAQFPLRVPIEPVWAFPEFISEGELFSRQDVAMTLWNPFYKKALRRGRAATPLTPDEASVLLQLLFDRNAGHTAPPPPQLPYPNDLPATNRITIDLTQRMPPLELPSEIPGHLDLNAIPYVNDGTSDFLYEKQLEAWLAENFDSDNPSLRSIFGPLEYLDWFGNYLPSGIGGANIDFVALHSHAPSGAICRISVVELQLGPVNQGHVDEVIRYARWVSSNLTLGTSAIVRPIVIGRTVPNDVVAYAQERQPIGFPAIWLVGYEIGEDDVEFIPANFEPVFP